MTASASVAAGLYDGPMNWLRRTGLSALLMSLLLVLGTSSAFAADISTVADDAAVTGFYLDPGVSISEADATEIVSAARNNGSRFHLVVLDDTPLGGSVAFADAVYDSLGIDAGTVLVLSPEDVGWTSEDEGFTEDDMLDAFDLANARGGNDAEYAANFVVGLVGESVGTEPATEPAQTATTTGQTAAAAESSGGGSGFLWFIVIIGGLGLLMFFLIRRGGKKQTVNAASEQMAKARLAVQKQVDAVANDILDMEDEVRVADNSEADRYYNEASETYRTITARLQKAESPQQLLDISNDLDVAIWQLDCAEAVLDGKAKPPRPEPKRLEPERRPAGDRVTVPPPRQDYQRRPSRRSSYLGPGMLEMLIGVAGQVLAGGGRGSRGGGLGSLLGRRSSSPRRSRSDGPSARSGGGVIPGPGSRVQRRSSTRSTRSSRPSRRRSGGGRIRGGGRRRK